MRRNKIQEELSESKVEKTTGFYERGEAKECDEQTRERNGD